MYLMQCNAPVRYLIVLCSRIKQRPAPGVPLLPLFPLFELNKDHASSRLGPFCFHGKSEERASMMNSGAYW